MGNVEASRQEISAFSYHARFSSSLHTKKINVKGLCVWNLERLFGVALSLPLSTCRFDPG